jgi:ABC-type bacteriocin/lantibiotic exporter with double-glycine peptidase domain
MMPKLYEAIDMAVTSGVPINMLADVLTKLGWPSAMVNQAVYAWLRANGRRTIKTDFKDWVKKYQKRARPAVAVVVFLGLVQAAVALLKPWPTKIMADSAFGKIRAPGPLADYSGTPKLIAITALMSIALFLIGAAFDWISDYILLKIGFWLNRSIKAESFRHILHLPLFHQERLAKGDYVYRQNIVTNSLSDLVLGTTSSIIGSIVMIIGVLAIMVTFNPKLTLVSVVLMPLLYLTMRLIAPHIGKYSQKLTVVNTDEDKECYSVDFLWTFDDDEVDYYRYTYHGYTYQGKKITKIEWMYISIR